MTSALPLFDDLPHFHEFSGCAWGLWGADDELGTVNLLTDELVKQTAQEEVRTGKSISLNWPINFPLKPFWGRKSPDAHSFVISSGHAMRDDELHINTQSGTQWDGLKHYGVQKYDVFYNNTPAAALPLGRVLQPDPGAVDQQAIRLGIHKWAEHGICGRGVLLDLVAFHESSSPNGNGALPYDPFSAHAIGVDTLQACAAAQGVTFRPGDVLLLRVGFIRKFTECAQEERDAVAARKEAFAGVEQSEDMKRFLWNNHFAAVASDQPAFERWPAEPGVPQLHETILGLWGMPIGEFFDLEALSAHCAQTGRHTFFLSSWPLNVLGGVGSPANAAAFF